MRKLFLSLIAAVFVVSPSGIQTPLALANLCTPVADGRIQPTLDGREMKIPHTLDLSPTDGPDRTERLGDHPDSPYFSHIDFYNAESTDTLTILPKFKTYQQTSEWSCGPAAALMALNYYGRLGGFNERTLAGLRTAGPNRSAGAGMPLTNGAEPGATSLRQMIEIFDGVGRFDLYSTYDLKDPRTEFTLPVIRGLLKEGKPILIGWNDWGGHWQVIIGYDTMGTEIEDDDVLIVADPYDTTDHNQDGYGVYPAQRFWYNFTFYNFFGDGEVNDMAFLVATPKE